MVLVVLVTWVYEASDVRALQERHDACNVDYCSDLHGILWNYLACGHHIESLFGDLFCTLG